MFTGMSISESGVHILSVLSYDSPLIYVSLFDFEYAYAEPYVYIHRHVRIMCPHSKGFQKYRDTLIIIFSLDMFNFEVPSTCL